MANFFVWAKKKVSVDTRLIATYCIVYVLWGMGMNWIGTALEIAKFENWWQVVTCYVLYMVPVSLLLRQLPFHTQYAYGLIAMAFLEFGGYYFGTSFAYPDNFVEQFFGIRNFALGMALFFALYFPFGNWGVWKIYTALFHPVSNEHVENRP